MSNYPSGKCVYCGSEKIYNSVVALAKKLNAEMGLYRGGHRGQTSKKTGEK